MVRTDDSLQFKFFFNSEIFICYKHNNIQDFFFVSLKGYFLFYVLCTKNYAKC